MASVVKGSECRVRTVKEDDGSGGGGKENRLLVDGSSFYPVAGHLPQDGSNHRRSVDPTADRLADFPVAKGTNLTYCVTHRGPPLTRSSAVRPVRTAVLDGNANFPLPQNHPTAALFTQKYKSKFGNPFLPL
jgi:hypothetical protein